MTPLNRKLWRDLNRMKVQSLAIGAVIAVGVMLLVMMSGIVTSLTETRRAYYERNHFADVFVSLKRAPLSLLGDLRAISGVSAVEGRVAGTALINLDSLAVPIRAQAVSLPDVGMPRLNVPQLTAGRFLNAKQSDEILLLDSFAKAHDLKPGDQISATMNGSRRRLDIVGLVQSPEFLYSVAPGELISDDSRFGVIWMSQTALGAAFDMRGAFNEALILLGRRANKQAVIEAADLVLEAYGGRGAYGRLDQISHRFTEEEISGMRASSKSVPPIFLAVAAFLLNIVISRMVQSEREQIGLIKAFGYSNWEVGGHYLKLVLIIATLGALSGCLLGIAAGRAMMGLYLTYFKFPLLVFQVEPSSFVIGILVSVLAASAGGLLVLRSVFALTPALAMRPPAPADYSRTGRWGAKLNRLLDQPSRMVVRRIFRQPGRMAGSIIGIATGMALSVAMISLLAGFDRTLLLSFDVIDRSDITVSFTHPLSKRVIFDLEKIPGILDAEASRQVSVVFSNGLKSHRGALTGYHEDARLNRAIAKDLSPIIMRKDGILLSKALAQKLDIRAGQLLYIDVREGRQPSLSLPVVGVAESLIGSPAYMEISALNRALSEPNRISSAYLSLDRAREEEIYQALKAMPNVAGVAVKDDARNAFIKMMNEGAGGIRFVMTAIAAIITFGIVYNAARIAFAERERDLASLRVIGFTKGEAAFVLLGELAVVTLLALPIGALMGYYFTFAIANGFSTDLYQIPVSFSPASFGIAGLTVLSAALFSGWLVKWDLDRQDLISALKTRE
ncbi:MAG: FtsX-like permease family protein [Cohaesibacter sp.]|jgi:putative ABC transport system permease protein|nr:FtsX-like permease family protein [Cohaesibacter sp.]